MKVKWKGVFPAASTQFRQDQSLDLDATARHLEVLIDSGITGLVMLGSLGENTSLEPEEKRRVMELAIKVSAGRVPVLSGVAECGTAAGCRYARDMEKLGADGLMVLPAMVYKSDPRETVAHFRAVARSSGLPILVYNNPIGYGVDLTPDMFAELADEKTLVAIKESSGDPRRITDIFNTVGDRYAIFCGVDDLILESVVLGAQGWVAGLGLAFPRENQHLWDLMTNGNGTRHGRCTAGTRRCCTWMCTSSSCTTSSWRSRNAAWDPSGCARRACRSPAPSASACLRSSTAGSRTGPTLPARWGVTGETMPPHPHRVSIIDSHTAGEPTRVILSGGPDLGAGSAARQLERISRSARPVPLRCRQ